MSKLKKILGIFRPQPRKCSSCLDLSPGLHQVWSVQRAGHLTEKLCTKCLTTRLATAILGKTIVFVEPLTSDGYCYTPVTGTATLSLSRMQQALSALPLMCSACTNQARHLWMPQDDLDFNTMEKQQAPHYYSIPQEPTKWAQIIPFCDTHLISHLR